MRRRWRRSFTALFIGIRANKAFTCKNCPRLLLLVFEVAGAEDLILTAGEIDLSRMHPAEYLAKKVEAHRIAHPKRE